ncbi:vWA domain-containing protein [Larkinella terrae]|uniref:VWA domain-containing protein n=1 Tax=Larkinella terrae TaxID=2025311 RepID=A0A7K0EET4_9BACT|nr:vWA domain-containing protein [Larkinella terrae]MRS60327.1 VWA domain-containing protein [Larkinella terrae]
MKSLPFSSFYTVLATLLIGLAALSCRKEVEIVLPGPLIEGQPSAASMAGKPLSTAGSAFKFTVDLYVVNKSGRYVSGLSKQHFSIPDNTVSQRKYTLDDVKTASLVNKPGGYSAMILLDQSGSILTTDPNDLRIEGSKIFLDYLGKDDYVSLVSFPTNSSDSRAKYHKGFSRDINAMKASLDTLAQTERGGTPLYKTAFEVTNYTAANAKTVNKAVIVFTDGADTDGGKSLQNVIDNAVQKSIPIFTVGLSSGVDVNVLSQMANETGGAFFWAKDAKQLITSFGTLGNLLRGTAQVYRTYWTVTRATGTWRAGDVVTGTIKVDLKNGEIIEVPFWVKVQ